MDVEERIAALRGDALRDELKRVLRTRTGGVKGVAAQRAKLVDALRVEEAAERFPGLWVEGEMPDPDPQLMPREGEEEGAKGAAAPLMTDDSATPLDYFLFNALIVGSCPPERRIFPGGA